MTVPTHFRVNCRGHFGTSLEGWSFGFHMQREFGGGVQDSNLDDVDIEGVGQALADYLDTPYVHNRVVADDVRVYHIGHDGRMVGNGPKIFTYTPGAVKGAGSANPVPPQVSLAITLVATNRGAAKLGRFFLPGPTQAVQDDMRLTDAAAATYATEASAFLKSVSDAINAPLLNSTAAINVSSGPAGSSSGTWQIVDHVEVGRVVDTIRSRRNSLKEDRHADSQIDW